MDKCITFCISKGYVREREASKSPVHFDRVKMSEEQGKQTNHKEPDSLFSTFVGFRVIEPLVIAKWKGGTEYILFFKENIEKAFWFSTQ